MRLDFDESKFYGDTFIFLVRPKFTKKIYLFKVDRFLAHPENTPQCKRICFISTVNLLRLLGAATVSSGAL